MSEPALTTTPGLRLRWVKLPSLPLAPDADGRTLAQIVRETWRQARGAEVLYIRLDDAGWLHRLAGVSVEAPDEPTAPAQTPGGP